LELLEMTIFHGEQFSMGFPQSASADAIRRKALSPTRPLRHTGGMKDIAPATLVAATLALAACGSADKPEEAAAPAASAAATATTTEAAGAPLEAKEGEISVSLSNGAGASVRLPPEVMEKIGQGSKMDVEGVGMFPGARVTGMAVESRKLPDGETGNAVISFSAPASPDAVAEWYVAAYREKGHKAERQGNRVDIATSEGTRIRIDLEPDGSNSKGRINVLDGYKSGA
jgi:hypothetical protein